MAERTRSAGSSAAPAGLAEPRPARASRSALRPGPALAAYPAPAFEPEHSLPAQVERGLELVTQALDAHLQAGRESAELTAPGYGALWISLAAQVGGGKLLRPRLTLAAYVGLGGSDVAGAAPIAAAQELLHTAMVVHDDVLDHDEMRRGRPNLAGARRAELAAAGVTGKPAEDQVLAAALLGGDLALTGAFELIASAPVAPELRIGAIGLLVRSVTTTIGGEVLDVAAQLVPPTNIDALLIAELKTAAYTCSGPLVVGALLAGADDRTRAQLDRLGVALGVAFQLIDDELGVFGDPAATGKSVLSDLREGKRTELLRMAYLAADDAGRAVLDRFVGDPELDADGAARVRAVIVACGALERTRAVAAGAARTAREIALSLPMPLAHYLRDLIDELAGREC